MKTSKSHELVVIRAMMFDLDGTLVQSEDLKAQSYAIAVQRLRGLPAPDVRAFEAYRESAGAAIEIASRYIADALGLESDLRPLMDRYDASDPVAVLSAMRTAIYDDMVSDPQVIRDNQWPHTAGLLQIAAEAGCRTALVTMSLREEALHAVRAMGLEEALDLVLTRDDVQRPKPDPEIYLLAARKLAVRPPECIVLEDSLNGIRAGVAAGMNVIAVPTPFTANVRSSEDVLERARVVRDSVELLDVVRASVTGHGRRDR